MGKTSSEWREAPGQTGLRKKQKKRLDADKGAGGRERKINEDLGSGRLAGRQHGGVGRGSAADLSELSEVARIESEDMEMSRGAWFGACVST